MEGHKQTQSLTMAQLSPGNGTEKTLTTSQNDGLMCRIEPMWHMTMEQPVSTKRKPRSTKAAIDPNATEKPTQKRSRAPKMVIVQQAESTTAIELRKPVEALTMKNASSGEITFLQRKIYNSMLQIAQNRPPEEASHVVPIKDFETLVGHTTSNSREYLKNVLRQMVSTQVEFDYKGDSSARKNSSWGIANMVAEVYISEDGNSITFSFPPKLKKRLLDPEIYNRLDLRMQNRFSSFSALTLYEIVSRYHTFKFQETFRDHWTTWSMLLSGAAAPHTEFRDFNKMLNRAVEQVNSIEPRFNIIPHSTKKERKIDKLWFALESQAQTELMLVTPHSMISNEVTQRLKALGLSDADVTAFGMDYDEEYLLAQADNTEARMKKKNSEPIASPTAYFKSAVKENYAKAPMRPVTGQGKKPEGVAKGTNTPESPKKANKGAQMDLEHLKEAWKKSKTLAIQVELEELGPEQIESLIEKYDTELRAMLGTVVYKQMKNSPTNKLATSSIVEILFAERHVEPNSDELLKFLLDTGLSN